MKVSFESTYLASQQANLFSQWDTTVYFEEGESESRFNESSLVLPPIQKKLLIKVKFDLGDGTVSPDFLGSVLAAFIACSEFWSDLNYNANFQIGSNDSVYIHMECRLFSLMKTRSLLEQPLSMLKHENLNLVTVSSLSVCATFLGETRSPCDALRQCNEYMVSLFLSQLEFQFPLVFSRVCRQRFLQQETNLGPVSYALANSTTMIPRLIKLISADTTATTCYRILQLASDHRKMLRLQKFKEGVSPFQIVKHS